MELNSSPILVSDMSLSRKITLDIRWFFDLKVKGADVKVEAIWWLCNL